MNKNAQARVDKTCKEIRERLEEIPAREAAQCVAEWAMDTGHMGYLTVAIMDLPVEGVH